MPDLTSSADPVLGTTITLQVGNSAPSPVPAVWILGDHSAQLPGFWGGKLLAEADVVAAFLMPASGAAIPVSIPNLPALCDTTAFLQAIEGDPGAVPKQVSSSRGLRLRLGL